MHRERGRTSLGRTVALALALLGAAQAAADPVQTWLRGVLTQVSVGKVDAALGAFDTPLRTPEWRTRLMALHGLRVTALAPEPGGPGRYALFYRVPQGALSLNGAATLSVQTPSSRPRAWRITAWTMRDPARLDAMPAALAPGTSLALHGSGFPTRSVVELRLEQPGGQAPSATLGRVQTSLTGTFSLSARVPTELASLPPDVTSLQVLAGGPEGALVVLALPFRSANAPGDLNARYEGTGFGLRYPSTYRTLGSPGSLVLVAPGGQMALRLNLLPRGGDPAPIDPTILDAEDDAALFELQHPDLLPLADTTPTPLGPDLFGWTLPLAGGRAAAVLPDPADGTRWAVLVAEPGFTSLLPALARALNFGGTPSQGTSTP